jgi:hypothetical protein
MDARTAMSIEGLFKNIRRSVSNGNFTLKLCIKTDKDDSVNYGRALTSVSETLSKNDVFAFQS